MSECRELATLRGENQQLRLHLARAQTALSQIRTEAAREWRAGVARNTIWRIADSALDGAGK